MTILDVRSAVDKVASAAGLEPAAAEQATGIILSVLSQELDPGTSAALFARLAGAQDLAESHPVSMVGAGLFASIAGSVMGARAGIAAAGLAELRNSGLSIGQIEHAGSALLEFLKANSGAKLAARIAAAIPSLIAA